MLGTLISDLSDRKYLVIISARIIPTVLVAARKDQSPASRSAGWAGSLRTASCWHTSAEDSDRTGENIGGQEQHDDERPLVPTRSSAYLSLGCCVHSSVYTRLHGHSDTYTNNMQPCGIIYGSPLGSSYILELPTVPTRLEASQDKGSDQ